MKYTDYLKSEYWKTRRNEFKSKTWGRCFICHSKEKLEVHHKRYSRLGKSILFSERHNDLRLLCRRCHSYIHKNGLVSIFASNNIKRRSLRDMILK